MKVLLWVSVTRICRIFWGVGRVAIHAKNEIVTLTKLFVKIERAN